MYNVNSCEMLASHICADAIDDFRVVYKHYLQTGNKVVKHKYHLIHLNETVIFMLSENFKSFNRFENLSGIEILLIIAEEVEKEIEWTRHRKLSNFLRERKGLID